MRDNSAENTSKITTSERDSSLGTLSIVGLLTWETLIDHLNNSFERGELHHSVRDLTSPKRIQPLVESSKTFFSCDCADPIEGAFCERRDRGLHPDFDSFKWAKSNIGDEFGRGTGSKIEPCFVLGSVFWSCEIGILFLEEFVSSILEGTLS